MTAPVVVGTYKATATTAASYNVSFVAQPGDLVVVAYGISNPADSALGVNTAGYTEVANLYANDDHDTNLAVAYKIMGGTPDSLVNVSGPSSSNRGGGAVVYVIRNAHPSTPMDVTATTASGVNTFTPDPPAITPVTPQALVIAVGAGGGVLVDDVGTAPAGYQNLIAACIGGLTDSFLVAMASKPWSGSGAENPGVFADFVLGASGSLGSWTAATLAIRPSPDTLSAPLVLLDALANCSANEVFGNLEISIPSGGTAHNLLDANQNAPVVYQPSGDTDFEIQTKYVGDLTVGANEEKGFGLVAFGASLANCVSFGIKSTTTGGLKVQSFAQIITSSVSATQHLADLTTNLAQSFYLCVNRTGNVWTFLTSFDGINWTQKSQFSQALTVSKVGIYATNAGSGVPAHLAKADYLLPDVPRGGVALSGVVTEAPSNRATGTGIIEVSAHGVVREGDTVIDYAVGTIVIEALQDIPKFYDRVHEVSMTEGLLDFTINGPYSVDHKRISDRYVVGEDFYYTAISRVAGGGWESGIGHLDINGKLVRETIHSSSVSDAKINFGSGPKDIIIALSAHYINDLADRLHAITVRLNSAGI